MGYLKNENQFLRFDESLTVSSKVDEPKTNFVGKSCLSKEEQQIPDIFKKLTQGSLDIKASDNDHSSLQKLRVEDMNVANAGLSRGILTMQIAILLLIFLCSAEDIGLQSVDISKDHVIYESLSTQLCNPENLDMTQSCHVEGSDLNEMLINHCGFKNECSSGNTPVCVDIDEGMVFICIPVITYCTQGYRWNVQKDKEDGSKVYVSVEECPLGSFQRGSSDCINACKTKHKDLENIPEWYTVFSEGNTINPTYVYCNYKLGYYNSDGQFLLDYDQESDNPNYCDAVNATNPCVKGRMPLPNGTCVLPCTKNECRDEHDNFICKQTCRYQDEERHAYTDVPDIETNEVIKTTKWFESLHILWIVIGLVGVGVTIVAVIFLRKKCYQRCDQAEHVHMQNEDSSTATDELTTVTESSDSTGPAGNAPNKSKQNCPSIIFDGRGQNINLVQNFYQRDDPTTAKQDDNYPAKSKEETYASFHTEIEEKEHLLAKNADPKERKRTGQNKTGEESHVRDFKKLYNDTNTQAEISCLNNLMQSCGALLHRHKVIGSAFLAGQKHVITAFHVIHEIVRDNTGESDYNFALIETKEISINFNGSVLNRQKRDIFLKYRYHNETYDIAVLKIKDLHLHKELPDPLMLWQYNISFINQIQVILIGYGNASKPNDKCKETCELIGENDFSSRHRAALASLKQNEQQYKNAIPGNDKSSIEYGYSGVDNEAFIKFDCFMEKGLSGGPVILPDGGHSPKVIGIVKGGMPDFYYDLPPEIQASFEKKYLFEVGVKMQMIYETMKREDPGLASELFPENRE